MYCPNCGAAAVPNQHYCRMCGVGLTVEGRTPFNLRAWILVALMLMFGGLLVAMGGKIWDVKWVIFTGLLIMFSGIFAVTASALVRPTRSRRQAATQSPATLPVDTTNKLPPLDPDKFIPSVVDETTELLHIPARQSRDRSE